MNGAIGTIEAFTPCEPGLTRKIEISGEKGSICIEDNRIVDWGFKEPHPGDEDILKRFDVSKNDHRGALEPTVIGVTYHGRVVENFVSSLTEKREPLISGVEGKKSADLICAAYKYMRQNGAVVSID